MLTHVRFLLLFLWGALGVGWSQTGEGGSAAGLSELPSVESKSRVPALEEPPPSPDFSGFSPAESPSIPQLRPPQAEKAKDQDWAAQAMLQKKEEAKKKEREQAQLEEQKAGESREALEKEKAQGEQNKKAQPTVSKTAAPGLAEPEAQKLPVVSGLDGVKPRGLPSGDGRVQPGFDSFTGPSSTGPLGKDFQSGAKPIMPGTSMTDGRIQVPPKPPEVPSGGYKRISQDPYSVPPGYGEKKATPPPAPKPVVIPANPASGDPKRAIDDTKAGYSPYDNTKKVPDPRSQRRF